MPTRLAHHGRRFPRRRPTLAAVLAGIALLLFSHPLTSPSARAQSNPPSAANPTGPTGDFNGEIDSGCGYDPLTYNAKRAVTDCAVPNSQGDYPLAFTRIYNSRRLQVSGWDRFMGDAWWRHSYQWALVCTGQDSNGRFHFECAYPDGAVVDFVAGRDTAPSGEPYLRGPAGTGDRLEWRQGDLSYAGTAAMVLRRADGGQVVFDCLSNVTLRAAQIIDPHGAVTQLLYNNEGVFGLTTVIEPGGRQLRFTYNTYAWNSVTWRVIGKVQSVVGNTVVNEVGLTYDLFGNHGDGSPYLVLTHAFYYSEASVASPGSAVTALYNYTSDTGGGWPLLESLSDPHYAGPMVRLRYNFAPSNSGLAWGTTGAEIHNVPGSAAGAGEIVSRPNATATGVTVETRGDGPQRTVRYGEASTAYGTTNAQPGLLTSATDYQGNTSYYYYTIPSGPGSGWTSFVVDRRGQGTSMVRENFTGKITRINLPGGTHRDFTYTDANHSDARFPYYLYSASDEKGQKTVYHRDHPSLYPTQIDYPDNGHEQFTYQAYTADGGAHVFYKLRTRTTTRGAYFIYNYDEPNHGGSGMPGLLTSVSRPAAGDNNARVAVSLFYDGFDRLQRAQDELGNSESTSYNARHQVTRLTHQDGTHQDFTYDDNGNRLTASDELGHVTTTTYDEYRRPLSVQAPVDQANGVYRTTSNDYNRYGVSGSAYQHTTANAGVTWLPGGPTIVRYFSANWWLTQRVDGAGSSADQASTSFAYDANGNVTSVTDLLNRVATASYDALNRKAQTVSPNGQPTTFGYDAVGNLLSSTDSLNRTTTFAYDVRNRRTLVQDPKNQQTRTAYDTEGNVTAIYDGANHPGTGFQYDLLNRLYLTTFADNTTEARTYDAHGNLATVRNRAGATKTMRAYDSRNRLSGWDWNDNNTTASCAFGYDAANRMTVADNWHSHIALTYNDAGQVLSELQSVGYQNPQTVTYDYDGAGRVGGMRYPSGGYFRFGYTLRNQVASVALDGPGVLASYQYNADSTRHWRSLLNGTVTNYASYDKAGRLTQQHHARSPNNPANIAYRSYGYTATNQLSWLVRDDNAGAYGDDFYYDADNQLTRSVHDATSVEGSVDGNGNSTANPNPNATALTRVNNYSFDAAGNRLHGDESGTGLNTNYSSDGLNRYVGSGYDALGDVTSFPSTHAGNWSYGYNAEGQLRTVSGTDRTGAGHSATLYYDALGRCVARYLDGVGTYLYYDRNWNLIEQRSDGGGQFQYAFVHGPGTDEMICRIGSGPTLWFHQDVKGDVVALSDDNGNVAERYRYDPYGQPYVTDGPGNARPGNKSAFANRILHKGRDWLGEVGLYDYRARAYCPALGRFLQPDPSGFKSNANANLYEYALNEPINNLDPSGCISQSILRKINLTKNNNGSNEERLSSNDYNMSAESGSKHGPMKPRPIRPIRNGLDGSEYHGPPLNNFPTPTSTQVNNAGQALVIGGGATIVQGGILSLGTGPGVVPAATTVGIVGGIEVVVGGILQAIAPNFPNPSPIKPYNPPPLNIPEEPFPTQPLFPVTPAPPRSEDGTNLDFFGPNNGSIVFLPPPIGGAFSFSLYSSDDF